MKQYTVLGKLAYLNDHDSANRSNKFAGAALKREMTDLVAWQLKGKDPITAPCFIKFIWHFSTNHDPDNIRFAAKYVLDGMVKAGVLSNDSQKWIMGFDGDIFKHCESGDEKVEIIAREYPEHENR